MKVCIVTASRSEYGLLRWLIDEVNNDNQLILQLVVTGSHLSPEFGLTYSEIESDGYKIDEKVDIILSSCSKVGVVKTMGMCSIGFADAFNRLKPNIVVVLGDRYELLPICSAALIMNIPIAHISGGDITEGTIDNQVRNAVTMMASIHFPGVEESALRIEKMIGNSENIYIVGEPGLDNFKRLATWNRETISESLSLDISKKWILLTYHPETRIELDENLKAITNIIKVLNKFNDVQVVITGANSDFGGFQINEISQRASICANSKFKFYNSLGQLRYLSFMKEVALVIGNSSSGIVEAPFLAKSVVNVGGRQKGRYISANVINTSTELNSISDAIKKAICSKVSMDNYFGDGNSSIKIKDTIKNFLLQKI